jgi:adenylate cyclase
MKILVADDNYDSRRLITDIVRSRGYEPYPAVDGQEALELARSLKPDLIILDVNMPILSGFEVCGMLKRDPATTQIPIIMLTALSEVEHRVEGLRQGADDYVGKPFSTRELIARIETRIRAKAVSDDLRQTRQLIRETFERFVAPSVVEQLLRHPERVKLGGILQEVTVLFADLENFTSVAEVVDPETLLSTLNRYHALVVNVVRQNGGTIDKFIGDAVMALYNTPLEQPDHAERAVMTALQIRQALPDFHATLPPELQMGINFGIHTGMAVVGNVGTPELMDFTAVGDAVNVAARLQQFAHGSQILIGQATYTYVQSKIATHSIGEIPIKGRRATAAVYAVE